MTTREFLNHIGQKTMQELKINNPEDRSLLSDFIATQLLAEILMKRLKARLEELQAD